MLKGLGRSLRRSGLGLCLLGGLGLAVTACSVSSTTASGGTLISALATVSKSPVSTSEFVWEDQTEARKLDGLHTGADIGSHMANPQWALVAGLAIAPSTAVEPALTTATGIDPLGGSRAVSIGQSRNASDSAVRIDGVTTSKIKAALTKLEAGSEPSDGLDFLVLPGADGVDSALGDDVAFVISRAVLRQDSVAYGAADGPIEDVLGTTGPPLSQIKPYQAMASCLGPVFVAEIRSSWSGDPSHSVMVGFGILTPAQTNDTASEVACALIDSPRQARILSRLITARTAAAAVLPAEGSQIQDHLTNRRVEVLAIDGQELVRVQFDDQLQTRAGFVFEADASGELSWILGGRLPGHFAPELP